MYIVIIVGVIVVILIYRIFFYKGTHDIPMSSCTEVYEFLGKTKDQLYTETRDWFVETFTDSKSVLEVQDKENGILKGKGILDTLNTVCELANQVNMKKPDAYCNSTFIIGVNIKDEKVKIDIKESNREWFPIQMGFNKKQQEAFSQLSALYCESYKDFIENSNSKADF